MSNQFWGADYGYDSLDENSSDVEKINVFLNSIKDQPFAIVDYKKLGYRNNEGVFNALIKNTGFVEQVKNDNSYYPSFSLNDAGYLMFNRHGSYLNYHANMTTQVAIDRGNEFKNQERQKEIEELQIKLGESQIKINELLLIKKPNWKERNWLWIAIVAGLFGFFLDIGKEVVKHKMWPEKKEAGTQTQEKLDSVP